MTEAEARNQSIKETDYCLVLRAAWSGKANDSICLERIFVKETSSEEIRLAWWKDGRITPRPADLDAIDWVPLFTGAVQQGVFTDAEKLGMVKALLK